jgi:hypothetical protein
MATLLLLSAITAPAGFLMGWLGSERWSVLLPQAAVVTFLLLLMPKGIFNPRLICLFSYPKGILSHSPTLGRQRPYVGSPFWKNHKPQSGFGHLQGPDSNEYSEEPLSAFATRRVSRPQRFNLERSRRVWE